VQFGRELWQSARRPAVARRCLVIAMTVGTILSLVNQWDALAGGRLTVVVWARVLTNYLVPFIVANLGAMASFRAADR
jgi:hypothetical protein